VETLSNNQDRNNSGHKQKITRDSSHALGCNPRSDKDKSDCALKAEETPKPGAGAPQLSIQRNKSTGSQIQDITRNKVAD